MFGIVSTHLWLSELQSSIDVSNSGKQKQVEITQTFLQCKCSSKLATTPTIVQFEHIREVIASAPDTDRSKEVHIYSGNILHREYDSHTSRLHCRPELYSVIVNAFDFLAICHPPPFRSYLPLYEITSSLFSCSSLVLLMARRIQPCMQWLIIIA